MNRSNENFNKSERLSVTLFVENPSFPYGFALCRLYELLAKGLFKNILFSPQRPWREAGPPNHHNEKADADE